MGNAGRLEGNLFDRLGHLERALQRGRIGQLDVHHEVALVLEGDEAAGDAGEAEARQADQADGDQQHDGAEAEAPAHGLAVGLGRPFKDPVEAMEETAQCPVHWADNEPAERPPATAPGRKRVREMPHVSRVAFRPPGLAPVADAPGSPPSQTLRAGASSHAVATPPNRAKLHHGRASLPWSPCWPGLRPAKIQTARAGVMVMALTAEMIIDTAMVSANWRKNWPVMPPRKALGSRTELSTRVMAKMGR